MASTDINFRKEALKIHNDARAEVGLPGLKWSGKLESQAQHYANYLAHRDRGLVHDRKTKDGENLFMHAKMSITLYYDQDGWTDVSESDGNSESDEHPIITASKAWLQEREDYTYAPIEYSNSENTGHYTQMIWSSTQHVGIAYAVSESGTVYVVARYSPRGNFLGVYPY
jgi:uncharacterized protein YkwD